MVAVVPEWCIQRPNFLGLGRRSFFFFFFRFFNINVHFLHTATEAPHEPSVGVEVFEELRGRTQRVRQKSDGNTAGVT